MINSETQDKRIISYLNTPRLIAVIVITTIALSVITASWTKNRMIRKINGEIVVRLNTYNSYLLDRVNNYSIYTKLLSERPHIIEYLKYPPDTKIQNEKIQNEMNEYLLKFNDAIGASVAYIINKNGITVASSNYKDASSLVGKNLGFREYFKNAMNGIPTEDIAVGVVTKILGYYRSHPVRNGDEIIGVAVIKYDVNVASHNSTHREEILIIEDDHGVIFHTNDKRYLYHTRHKLSEDTLKMLKDTKSYASEPLPPLPIVNESEKNGIHFVTLRHTQQAGEKSRTKEYIISGTHDNSTVWNTHFLFELSEAGQEIKKNVFLVISSMFVLYLIGAFLIHRTKSRQRLQESYNDVLEQKALLLEQKALLLEQKALLLEQKAIVDKHVKEQETINSVLRLSLSSESLEVHLQRKLDVLLAHTQSSLVPRGCIFLYDEKLNVLQLAVQRGLSDAHIAACAVVPSGKCLCGLAASTKEIVFSSDCRDSRHTITYDAMPEHGQYCVPIVSTDKQTDRLLGVISIHVPSGYERNDADEVFFKNIASIIASVILRKQELQLIELDRTESLTTLAAGIAHEINNPLSFIKASVSSIQRNLSKVEQFIKQCGILQKPPSDEELSQQLNSLSMMNTKIATSNKGIERIMEVVNGLRTFSRLNKSDVEEVDINKCIDEALSLCVDNRVTILKEYAQLPPYLCESRAINQCLYHILQNAFQAVQAVKDIGTQQPTIRIVTSQAGTEGEIVQIKIEDNGIGMSEDAVKRAFVPFFTTKEVGSGKGLGLSMVEGIISRHNGTIKLESIEGEGTTVTISLPIVQNKMFL
ncbi:ATP-binding protein [Candidatus Magnetominusculus xianensis]|uniref:histidine kinase n=1 Tax=Candidatus Magnetominusculus xianensis TaxID=1748249 RepID=A0ABR5SEP9_9BACT|nr:ATP-binding protein [Candidatus Magnetominusculus xianensis]KWT82792.1 putative Histidine kinase [Candidatus Magnetominusculus xianensis]MBF0403481.1 GAF domain-containing protein [Nitrospirota bacterium]